MESRPVVGIGVGQAKRQRIAGNKGQPRPAGELRRDAHADVPQGFMRRKRIRQQIRLPERIKNAGEKAVVRVVQSGDGTGNLLTARECGHLGHGRITLFQSGLAQGIGQHGRPRPQHDPALFQGAIAFQGIAPILQQGADVQAEVFGRQTRRLKQFGNAFPAAFRVIFKDHLKRVTRLGKC